MATYQFVNVFLIFMNVMILSGSKRSVNAFTPFACKQQNPKIAVAVAARRTSLTSLWISRKNSRYYTNTNPLMIKTSLPSSSSPHLLTISSTKLDNDNSDVTTTTTTTTTASSKIVRQLQQGANEKKMTRSQYLELDRQRNFELKRLIHEDAKESASSLIAVKVSVDYSLWRSIAMNGREKRGRMFVKSEDVSTIADFKQELHSFFRTLKRKSFVLHATLPSFLTATTETMDEDATNWWPLETDDHIVQVLTNAKIFFLQQQKQKNNATTDCDDALIMKRPTFNLHVSQDPHYVPVSKPAYLSSMPDPNSSSSYTMISFYSFFPIHNEEEFVSALKKTWKPFYVLGRVYVAKEGINAQMAIPTNVLPQFQQSLVDVIPEAADKNIINIDPIPLDKDEFLNNRDSSNNSSPPPFTNLHIRVRPQIVADGLLDSTTSTNKLLLDLHGQSSHTGYEMPPLEWHETLMLLQQNSTNNSSSLLPNSEQVEEEQQLPILLDCRNHYETGVGKFVGAEALNTEYFRESWDALKSRLKDTPKDAPIMTYCTGGIRCVKIGAYLTQELGFKNVSRLAGGIIAYDRALLETNSNKKENEQKQSLFKGTNYVFDNRVGRQITNDALGTCITCAGKTNLLNNCKNNYCHQRIVQCHECSTSYLGTCSDTCRQRVLNSNNGNMSSRRKGATPTMSTPTLIRDDDEVPCQTLDKYSDVYSSNIPPMYAAIEQNTQKYLQTGSHMVSGSMQGRFLYNLASMARTGRVLEIGTFTGYATTSFLEGVVENNNSSNNNIVGARAGGPFVLSLERDQRAYDLAVAHMSIVSELGFGTEAASKALHFNMDNELVAGNAPNNSNNKFCFVYNNAVACEIQRTSDALATVEEMAMGAGDNADVAPFDIVFIDADKTRLLEYTETCLANDRILRKGGLIVVDNTLYKGVVLEHTGAGIHARDEDEIATMDSSQLKRSRRAYQLAGKMHKFNKSIAKDSRCEVMILPIRDGLSLIRKK